MLCAFIAGSLHAMDPKDPALYCNDASFAYVPLISFKSVANSALKTCAKNVYAAACHPITHWCAAGVGLLWYKNRTDAQFKTLSEQIAKTQRHEKNAPSSRKLRVRKPGKRVIVNAGNSVKNESVELEENLSKKDLIELLTPCLTTVSTFMVDSIIWQENMKDDFDKMQKDVRGFDKKLDTHIEQQVDHNAHMKKSVKDQSKKLVEMHTEITELKAINLETQVQVFKSEKKIDALSYHFFDQAKKQNSAMENIKVAIKSVFNQQSRFGKSFRKQNRKSNSFANTVDVGFENIGEFLFALQGFAEKNTQVLNVMAGVIQDGVEISRLVHTAHSKPQQFNKTKSHQSINIQLNLSAPGQITESIADEIRKAESDRHLLDFGTSN